MGPTLPFWDRQPRAVKRPNFPDSKPSGWYKESITNFPDCYWTFKLFQNFPCSIATALPMFCDSAATLKNEQNTVYLSHSETVMLSWRSEPSVLDILPWRSLMIGDRIMGTTITDNCILLYLRPSFALSTSKCFHISLFLFFLPSSAQLANQSHQLGWQVLLPQCILVVFRNGFRFSKCIIDCGNSAQTDAEKNFFISQMLKLERTCK